MVRGSLKNPWHSFPNSIPEIICRITHNWFHKPQIKSHTQCSMNAHRTGTTLGLNVCRYVIKWKLLFSISLQWDEIGFPIVKPIINLGFASQSTEKSFNFYFRIKDDLWRTVKAAIMYYLPHSSSRIGKGTECNQPSVLHSHPHEICLLNEVAKELLFCCTEM